MTTLSDISYNAYCPVYCQYIQISKIRFTRFPRKNRQVSRNETRSISLVFSNQRCIYPYKTQCLKLGLRSFVRHNISVSIVFCILNDEYLNFNQDIGYLFSRFQENQARLIKLMLIRNARDLKRSLLVISLMTSLMQRDCFILSTRTSYDFRHRTSKWNLKI